MRLARPSSAIMRAVPSSIEDCLRADRVPLDPSRAARQHAACAALLRELGIEVTVLEADEACPDCCFIEDTAVVLPSIAVLGRPAEPSRRAEPEAVGEFLSGTHEIRRIEGGTLEGGDVLRAGDTLFVGRTGRTDEAGIAELGRHAADDGLEVVAVEVHSGLHLKSTATLLDPETVLYREGTIDRGAFEQRGLCCVPAPEAAGANVLAFGRAVLVSSAAPRTAELVAGRGFEVHTLDVSELHKADGALTCLSLRIAPGGAWCV